MITGFEEKDLPVLNEELRRFISDLVADLQSQATSTVPSGCIVIWSGAEVDIPAGYVLCDGNNSTPDLRNRFVAGAGDTYNPDDDGGGSHSHTGSIPSSGDHTHTISTVARSASGGTGYPYTGVTNSVGHSHAGITTSSTEYLPPYYALCFIMKV